MMTAAEFSQFMQRIDALTAERDAEKARADAAAIEAAMWQTRHQMCAQTVEAEHARQHARIGRVHETLAAEKGLADDFNRLLDQIIYRIAQGETMGQSANDIDRLKDRYQAARAGQPQEAERCLTSSTSPSTKPTTTAT